MHVSDVVRANLLACENEKAVGQVFNITSGHGVSLLDLVDTLNGLGNTQLSPQFALPRAGDIRHSRGDGIFIATTLEFRPDMSLTEGLKQLYGSVDN